jgi:hypothetical protein
LKTAQLDHLRHARAGLLEPLGDSRQRQPPVHLAFDRCARLLEFHVVHGIVLARLAEGLAADAIDHQALGRAEKEGARVQVQPGRVRDLRDAHEHLLDRVGDVFLVAEKAGQEAAKRTVVIGEQRGDVAGAFGGSARLVQSARRGR